MEATTARTPAPDAAESSAQDRPRRLRHRLLHRRCLCAADGDRRRRRLDLSGHGQRGRAVAVLGPRRDPRPVRHRLRGDEPPHHQRRRLLRLRRQGHRQDPGRRNRLRRADRLQRDADRDPRPVRRGVQRLHARQGRHQLRLVHVGLHRDRRHRRPRLAARRPQRKGPGDLPHAGDHRRRDLRLRRPRRPGARRSHQRSLRPRHRLRRRPGRRAQLHDGGLRRLRVGCDLRRGM